MSTFVIYSIGYLILLAGLIYGAVLLHVPTQWIVVGGLVMLGLGIAMGVGKTRQKDTSEHQSARDLLLRASRRAPHGRSGKVERHSSRRLSL